MSSYNQANFQPPPPVRTSTIDSQKSQSSGQVSPPFSPASPTSRAHAVSPTEQSFFDAITSRITRGRSRSRSRGNSSRKRSKSPMIMPPEQMPATRSSSSRQANQTHYIPIANTPSRPSAQHTRPSLQDSRRSTSGSDPWRGRHSNEWLFNGFSVTNTTKEFLHRRKS